MAQVSANLAQIHTLMAQVLKLGIFDVFAKFWCQCVLKLGIFGVFAKFLGYVGAGLGVLGAGSHTHGAGIASAVAAKCL